MFFKHKRNQAKTTRQTLSTEQLEPKAMFNATAFETQICLEDRLGSSDMDANDIVLQVKNVALDVGPVNQAGDNGCLVIHPQFKTGNHSRMVIHPQFKSGNDGSMVIHPQFKSGGSDVPERTSFITGEDGVSVIHPSYHGGEDGVSVIHPSYHGGEDGVSVIHPSYHDGEGCRGIIDPENVAGSSDPGGDDIFMPKPNRIGRAYSLEGQAFLTGVNSLAQANQQPSLTNVWTNGSATSMAPRHAAFAMMGR